jgi:hypothetical protein
MRHDAAWEHLPDLLVDRDDPQLVAHVADCHACQQQLFRLIRIDRMLRSVGRSPISRSTARLFARVIATVAVAAAAATVWLAQGTPANQQTIAFALHTADGRTLGRAVVSLQNQATDRVVLVARGMPVAGGDQYLLWTQPANNGPRMPVGRFMVSANGDCRASFKLPADTKWSGFVVTTTGDPSLVVAST